MRLLAASASVALHFWAFWAVAAGHQRSSRAVGIGVGIGACISDKELKNPKVNPQVNPQVDPQVN